MKILVFLLLAFILCTMACTTLSKNSENKQSVMDTTFAPKIPLQNVEVNYAFTAEEQTVSMPAEANDTVISSTPGVNKCGEKDARLQPWVEISNTIGCNVWGLVSVAGYLFAYVAGTHPDEICYSQNGGKNWCLFDTANNNNLAIKPTLAIGDILYKSMKLFKNRLYKDVLGSSVIYPRPLNYNTANFGVFMGIRYMAFSYDSVIWISDEHARNWRKKVENHDIQSQGFTATSSHMFCYSYKSIFKTDDNSRFQPVKLPGDSTILLCLEALGNELFAATKRPGLVYRSTDEGKTWIPSADSMPEEVNIHEFLKVKQVVFALTDSTLYRSTDNGIHWVRTSSGLPIYCNVRSIAVQGLSVIAGTSSGTYASSDDGTTWRPICQGLPPMNYYHSMYVNDTVLTVNSDAGMSISFDFGKSWEYYQSKEGGIEILSNITIGKRVLIGTQEHGILLSGDRDRTQGSDDGVRSLVKFNSTLYAGTNHGIQYSVDSGANWDYCDPNLPEDVKALRLYVDNDKLISITDAGVFIMQNGSKKWEQYSRGLKKKKVAFVAINDNRIFAVCTDSVKITGEEDQSWMEERDTVMMFEMKTKQWEQVANPYFPDSLHVISMATRGSKVFIGTENGLVITSDFGRTWFRGKKTVDHDDEHVEGLAVCGDYLFAMIHNTIYRMPVGSATASGN